MERKIGETFEFEGRKFEVKAAGCGCDGCFFDTKCLSKNMELSGECEGSDRYDRKDVIFVEVQEQPEQPQKLNLCEILKYCPQGETFWSPMLGDVKLHHIRQEAERLSFITKSGATWDINADGTLTISGDTSPEIMLYPSREQRDWNKFTAPWVKKEKFDPKTLKPFDKVLSRYDGGCWSANLFSHIEGRDNEYCAPFSVCNGSLVKFCIPYNDDTKHLVGTTEEAPEFYRYWED